MVLGEELVELRDEIRANHIGRARAVAARVGAMALRFGADVYLESGSARQRGRVGADEACALLSVAGPQGRVLASSHEASGFLERECDAVWSAVRFDEPARPMAGRVAALSVRFIAEITGATVSLAVAGR
jgi:hypothetical protein